MAANTWGVAAPELVIVTGPTGIGKTDVAVELARQLNTEIISADSMQVYKHLSIGTAKPSADELRGVAYHLIDYVSPDEQYNLGWFLRDAEPLIERMKSAGKLPIVCGGTGLYLRGLLHGVFDGGGADEGIRCELEERLRSEGLPAMYRELQRVDPDATHIMPNDQQRILRALEVFYSSGRPISQLQTQTQDHPRYRAATFVLERPREELYARINARVDAMVDRGLIAEVREYLSRGFSRDNPAMSALGYGEIVRCLEGEVLLDAALDVMKQKSRNYAKRQLTWFRSMKNTIAVTLSGKDAAHAANEIVECITRQL